MIPTIGIMLGFYIITKMIEIDLSKGNPQAVRIFAKITHRSANFFYHCAAVKSVEIKNCGMYLPLGNLYSHWQSTALA